jgi:hypothetical protein
MGGKRSLIRRHSLFHTGNSLPVHGISLITADSSSEFLATGVRENQASIFHTGGFQVMSIDDVGTEYLNYHKILISFMN